MPSVLQFLVLTFAGWVNRHQEDLSTISARPRSPNLNPHAERWVRSVKDECLSKLILFGEPALRTALRAYVEHFHGERNHQGKDTLLLFPQEEARKTGPVRCRERLGGLLKGTVKLRRQLAV